MGSGKNKVSADKTVTSSSSAPTASSRPELIPTISKPKASAHATGVKSSSSLVLDEVQQALKEDESPLLGQLKQGEWVTDDLMSVMQKNPILLAGLQHPKCTAALELMQKDPKEAKKRFGNDPEVDRFLREFGSVMSSHFEALGAKDEKKKEEEMKKAAQTPIRELGPLETDALKKNLKVTEDDAEAKRVQEVLANDELRTLLMDPALQAILKECGDPQKFHLHMRDPVTSRKIQMLMQAGLVNRADS